MSKFDLLRQLIRRRLQRRQRAAMAALLLAHTRWQLKRLPLRTLLSGKPLLRVADRAGLAALRQELHKRLAQDSNPCLPRAVILYKQLAGLGHSPTLLMGAALNSLPGSGPLRAHAWVEMGGIPYAEPEGFNRSHWLETFRFPDVSQITQVID